jgi:hypothetical protein
MVNDMDIQQRYLNARYMLMQLFQKGEPLTERVVEEYRTASNRLRDNGIRYQEIGTRRVPS